MSNLEGNFAAFEGQNPPIHGFRLRFVPTNRLTQSWPGMGTGIHFLNRKHPGQESPKNGTNGTVKKSYLIDVKVPPNMVTIGFEMF